MSESGSAKAQAERSGVDGQGDGYGRRAAWRRFVPAVGLAVALVVNWLATSLPLNGNDTAEISARYPVLFTPANYVFGIWGAIYLGLGLYVVYRFRGGPGERVEVASLDGWFVVTCLANAAWLVFWHWERLGWTLVAMGVLLGSLIRIYTRLDRLREGASWAERVTVLTPFSLYLGWNCVATVANVAVFLYAADWNGWGLGPVTWTVVMLAAVLVIALATAVPRRDSGLLAVVVWAAFGIALRQSELLAVSVAAVGVAVIAGAAAVAAQVYRARPVEP